MNGIILAALVFLVYIPGIVIGIIVLIYMIKLMKRGIVALDHYIDKESRE